MLARVAGPARRRAAARFSMMSVVSVATLIGSGFYLARDYVGEPAALYGASYGVMLSAKIVLLAALLLLGGLNFLTVRRWRGERSTPILPMRRFAEVEIGIGLTVIFCAASLASLPPARDLSSDWASAAEVVERLAPRWPPRLESPDLSSLSITMAQEKRPSAPLAYAIGEPPAPPRNAADIAWSEYNHHWAGLFVLAMGGLSFPLFLAFKNLRHFILEDEKLVETLRNPIRYREIGRSVAEGIVSSSLRRILNVWVRAHQAGVLGPSQEKIAEKAQILLDALADTAIDALIDEATGYQKRRAHDALQKLLAAYVLPEFRPYQTKFPISFYEQIHRVMGWAFDAESSARTAYIGKLTNRLIYDQLPPGVHEDLRRKNPVDPLTKRRRRKHFQLLTEDIGEPHLDRQITAVTALLRATPSGQWKFFEMVFAQAFPPAQPDLFLAEEIERLTGPGGAVH